MKSIHNTENNSLWITVENNDMQISLNVGNQTIDNAFNSFRSTIISFLDNTNNINQETDPTEFSTLDNQQLDNNTSSYARNSTQNSNNYSSGKNKAHLNGGGSKPVSEKQINLIKTIAARNNINANSFIYDNYEKPIDHLTGAEANHAINQLKEKK